MKIALIFLVAIYCTLAQAATDQTDRSTELAELLLTQGYSDSALVVEAKSLWSDLAETGDRDSQYYLASLLISTSGNEADDQKALDLMLSAADLGQADAQLIVGLEFENKGDFVGAVDWYSRAAEQCRPGAVSLLIKLYTEGAMDLAADQKQAEYWRNYRKLNCGKAEQVAK